MRPPAQEASAAGGTREFPPRIHSPPPPPPSNLQSDAGSEPPENSGAGGVNGEPPPREPAPPPGLRTSSGSHDPLSPLDVGMNSEVQNLARLLRTTASHNEVLNKLTADIALIATLVATFTYVAGTNPPGGVHQDGDLRGTAIAGKRASFRVFFVFNNMALFTSLAVVLFVLSIGGLRYERKILDRLTVVAHAAIWVAIFFTAAAYAAASVVIMGGIGWTTIFVFCVCGFALVGVGIALVGLSLYQSPPEDQSKKTTENPPKNPTQNPTDNQLGAQQSERHTVGA